MLREDYSYAKHWLGKSGIDLALEHLFCCTENHETSEFSISLMPAQVARSLLLEDRLSSYLQ